MKERLGIAGSGAIACGLAATAAAQGSVVLWARSDASADRARKRLDKLCGDDTTAAERATVTTDIAGLGEATFVVEAIAEEYDAKLELLGRLDQLAANETVLASTTSSLSVERLAQGTSRPERFVGLHVFNPVTKMRLVELAYPEQATPETRSRAALLCKELGKTAVDVPDAPGFVVNRLLFPYLFSAVTLLEQTGLEPEQIDTCMTLGAGHPLGPLALLDFVGLDVSAAIGETLGVEIPERVRELMAEGALGRKAGRGFYTY